LTIRIGGHVIALYRAPEEVPNILGPYIAAGLANGERCVVFAAEPFDNIRRNLQVHGVDLGKSERDGQLIITKGARTAQAQSRLLAQLERDTSDQGYDLMRIAGDPCGVFGGQGRPTREAVRFESIVEHFFLRAFPMIALCYFDVSCFRGDEMLDLLRVHPLVVVGEDLVRNPFYAARDHQHGLTKREVGVLQLITLGNTDKEIAQTLGISVRTVQNHVASILEKMGEPSRAAASAQAIREGIVE
jgi:DNA-binding CsgD family transcriptional regulator